MTEKDFYEITEALCRRPKMYTPTGAFYEVVSFLEGFGGGANVGNLGYHLVLTPFRKWIAKKFNIQTEVFDWNEFRGLYSSDLEALENLPTLYREYLESR